MENQLALFCKDVFQESDITSKTMLAAEAEAEAGL